MGELESLLLVLGLIYLSECLVWVPRGASAFTCWWGRTFRWRPGGTMAGNHRGSLFLANPLPPLAPVFVNQPWPLSISAEAIFAYTAACLDPVGRPRQSGRYVRFDDLRSVEAKGKVVEVNGRQFLKTSSAFRAWQLAHWFQQLRGLQPSERAAAINRALQTSLDENQLSGRLRDYQEQTRAIRLLCQALFLYLSVVAPVLIWRWGLALIGWPLLVGLLALTCSVAWLSRRAHRVLYPAAEEERFKLFLTAMLTPLGAIRSADLLGRPLLADAHPLAVAKLLCSPAALRAQARNYLLDLRFPLLPVCPTDNAAAAACEAWFRAALLQATEEFVRRNGLDPVELTGAPARTESVNESYCPRCGGQFVSRAGTCPDCGGRPLVAF